MCKTYKNLVDKMLSSVLDWNNQLISPGASMSRELLHICNKPTQSAKPAPSEVPASISCTNTREACHLEEELILEMSAH